MKVKSLGMNQTEVEINSDLTILFSYSTPVACNKNSAFYRTAKKWSATTSKHINKWLCGANAKLVPQEFFDNLIV